MSNPRESYWEDFYRNRGAAWSGRPNSLLVEEVSELPPGAALDLGCGEGGDAIWLASRGWNVTAVEISATALARAAGHAAAAGVGAAIEWRRHDLVDSFPTGEFDLVSVCYLHSPVEMPRERVLRSAAAAVSPGGILLVVGHAGAPSWSGAHPDIHFPTPQEVLDVLALPTGRWEVRRSDFVTRELSDREGRPATRPDNVLSVERIAA
jgi:SAM-dependent methyltransferase